MHPLIKEYQANKTAYQLSAWADAAIYMWNRQGAPDVVNPALQALTSLQNDNDWATRCLIALEEFSDDELRWLYAEIEFEVWLKRKVAERRKELDELACRATVTPSRKT